ncbi:hypothetical protein [Streptomyces sp. JJ66]|uniref:hypothetical protein n=1 Tax=Streptomyces sp. JJ66 TaxID=2803843 RepID=UPI0035AFAE19
MQRQGTATAGRIEDSQVGVFLAYTTGQGRALIEHRLYQPEHFWCAETGRRRGAGVPGRTEFATKPRPLRYSGQRAGGTRRGGFGTRRAGRHVVSARAARPGVARRRRDG